MRLEDKKMFRKHMIGHGIVSYKPAYTVSGSGFFSNAFASLKKFATPLLKSTGKALLSSAKQLAPTLANTAVNMGLQKLAESGKVSDSTVNTLSGLSQAGTKALDKVLNTPDPKAPKATGFESNVSNFVNENSQKLLANLMAGKKGSGSRAVGSGSRRLGGNLLVQEAPRSAYQ